MIRLIRNIIAKIIVFFAVEEFKIEELEPMDDTENFYHK